MEGNNISLYTGYICSHGSLPMSSTIDFPFPSFFCFPWTFLIPLLGLRYKCQSTPRADSGVQKPTGRTTEKEEFLRSPNAVFFLVDSNTIPLGISCLIDSYEVKQLGLLGSHLDLLAAHAWFCCGSTWADKGNALLLPNWRQVSFPIDHCINPDCALRQTAVCPLCSSKPELINDPVVFHPFTCLSVAPAFHCVAFKRVSTVQGVLLDKDLDEKAGCESHL